jgi:hypothetical protein
MRTWWCCCSADTLVVAGEMAVCLQCRLCVPFFWCGYLIRKGANPPQASNSQIVYKQHPKIRSKKQNILPEVP